MSSVQATGEFAADAETGRRYAELAVAYARSKNSASFIELVLSDINIKTFIGETPLSGIEYGFFSRIALSVPRVEIGASRTA